jgi:hypothetical protein
MIDSQGWEILDDNEDLDNYNVENNDLRKLS